MTDETTLGSTLTPGQPLEAIAGKMVTVKRIEVTTTFRRGNDDTPVAIITLDDDTVVQIWDAYLIGLLEQVPPTSLPGRTMFAKTDTGWMMA